MGTQPKAVYTVVHRGTFTSSQGSSHSTLSYPTVDEYINKTWSIHTVKYYSVMKMKEALIHAVL